jgi:hypothetical protein
MYDPRIYNTICVLYTYITQASTYLCDEDSELIQIRLVRVVDSQLANVFDKLHRLHT